MHVLENRLAFYHSITVGDVDGDGLQDIIVQYFNSRDQVMKKNGYLLFLKQDAKGNFTNKVPNQKFDIWKCCFISKP